MLINLACIWFRGRFTGRMRGFFLVSIGALAVFVSKMGFGWENAAVFGVALTLAGSLLSAHGAKMAVPLRHVFGKDLERGRF